jgi:hypothetical protein
MPWRAASRPLGDADDSKAGWWPLLVIIAECADTAAVIGAVAGAGAAVAAALAAPGAASNAPAAIAARHVGRRRTRMRRPRWLADRAGRPANHAM